MFSRILGFADVPLEKKKKKTSEIRLNRIVVHNEKKRNGQNHTHSSFVRFLVDGLPNECTTYVDSSDTL